MKNNDKFAKYVHKETWLGRLLIDFSKMDSFDRESFLFFSFVFCLLALPVFTGVKVILADSKVDYCTIDAHVDYTTTGVEQTWNVTGVVNWRSNVLIAKTSALETAFALLQSPVCKGE